MVAVREPGDVADLDQQPGRAGEPSQCSNSGFSGSTSDPDVERAAHPVTALDNDARRPSRQLSSRSSLFRKWP